MRPSFFHASSFRQILLALPVMLPLLALSLPAHAQVAGAGTNYETRLSTLEDSMRALTGQVEQLGFAIRRLDQSMQRQQEDTEQRLGRLEAAAASMQQSQQAAVAAAPVYNPPAVTGAASMTPSAVPANPEPNGTLGALKLQQDGRVIGGSVNPQAPALPDTPADYGLTAQEQYDRAFGLLRQADYDGAEKAFRSFIDKNPKDKLVDNAKYWYAETLYVRGRFDDAAAAFGDAFQQNPKGTKAADSLLKMGMALAALNKPTDACVALGELRGKYPNASPTTKSRANDEWAKLKCS